MKKAELFQLVSMTANAVIDLKAQDTVKSVLNDNITRSTDRVVEYFGDDLSALALYLTDSISALHKAGTFGEGKKAANLRQNLSRRFATAVERYTAEWTVKMTLTGYNPVKVQEKKIKVRKTDFEILVEKAEALGADTQCLDEIKIAISKSQERAEQRSKALFEMAETERKKRSVKDSYDAIILGVTRGKSAKEIADFLGTDPAMTEKAVSRIKKKAASIC